MRKSAEDGMEPLDASAAAARARLAAATLARVGGLVTVSLLGSGCAGVQPGGSESATLRSAVRPQLHEVAPNPEPDCIAVIVRDGAKAHGVDAGSSD